MLTGRKLALTLAFTALIALAFGVSCTGFFPKNSLTAITIQPPSPQIEIGTPQGLQAWGTYANNTGTSQITSGVVWTSSDNSVLTIDPSTGVATGVGTGGGGTATVTASAQGLSGTASATVYLGSITGYEVCEGTYGATTSCSSGSTPLTLNVDATNSVTLNFVAQANNPSNPPVPPLLDLTTASTWTVESSISLSISCDNSISPASCTVDQGTVAGSYTISVTYGTGTAASSAIIDVVVTN